MSPTAINLHLHLHRLQQLIPHPTITRAGKKKASVRKTTTKTKRPRPPPSEDENNSNSNHGEKGPPPGKRGRKVTVKSNKNAKPTDEQIVEFEEIEKLIVNGVCVDPKKYRAGANHLLYMYQGVGLETSFDAMGPPGCGITGNYETTGVKVNVENLFRSKEDYEKWMKSAKLGNDADPGKEDWKSEKINRMKKQVCHLVDPEVDNVYACVRCLNNFMHNPEPGRTLHAAANHKCPTDANKMKGSSFRMVEQYKQYQKSRGKKSEEDMKMELIEKNEELQKQNEQLKTKVEKLKAQVEKLKARVEELEKMVAEKGSEKMVGEQKKLKHTEETLKKSDEEEKSEKIESNQETDQGTSDKGNSNEKKDVSNESQGLC
jgi:hypothetical protein